MAAVPTRPLPVLLLGVVLSVAAGCGSDEPTTAASPTTSDGTPTTNDGSGGEEVTGRETWYPDVIEATATPDDDGTWTVSATLSSPYDSADRYADAWRVMGADGTVYGIRELAHDHATEQPFTRSQSGIEIPDDVDRVTVEGRDQISGWGGATVDVALDRP